jgi:hypothetical protein
MEAVTPAAAMHAAIRALEASLATGRLSEIAALNSQALLMRDLLESPELQALVEAADQFVP